MGKSSKAGRKLVGSKGRKQAVWLEAQEWES